jgi:hypothetical protein
LEGLLRLPISSEAELQGLSIEELKHRAEFLQNTIRNRSSS